MSKVSILGLGIGISVMKEIQGHTALGHYCFHNLSDVKENLWSVWIEGEEEGVEQSIVDLAPKIVYFLANSTLLYSPSFSPQSKQALRENQKNKMK